MKTTFVALLLAFLASVSHAQEPTMPSPRAIYLTAFGGKTLFVLTYDRLLFSEFAMHGGVGLNNLDRTSSTNFRVGVSYLRGSHHMLELSLMVDFWTRVLNPIAREDMFFVAFAGYRFQPSQGLSFRLGINPLQLDEQHFDFEERIYNIIQASVGYSL